MNTHLIFVAFFATLYFVDASVPVAMGEPWEDDYRIPSDTLPMHYDLYLFPDLQTDRFSGRVTIHINATQPRDFFVTHINYMNVTKTEVRDSTDALVTIDSAFAYSPNEFWVVTFPQAIPAGVYTLYMEFDGLLDNGILGFYKSVYTNENGTERAIATTKFQPTYARRAFPCFDEPSFKSTFKVTLVRPTGDNYITLSNMRIESTVDSAPSPGYSEVTYENSFPMVTYLAVFIVSDFVHIDTTTQLQSIPFKVYGTTVQIDKLDYALDVGSSVLDYYTTYFGVNYPLPKMDMAAIPDYSSGATEHWGMITYRETNLIYDPNESSSSNKESVVSVIAHEMAHQWFGNLVTLEWWNDLWLNEGFAVFMSYKGVKSYETTWDTDSGFLIYELHPVFDLDATLSSHPIVVDVDTPDEINSVFDTISYNKGGSVIRMMEDFMGPTDFQAGISKFLTDFAFQNAVTQDLFDCLEEVSTQQLNITRIMNTWTIQKGYPVLTLTKEGNTYTIVQERFLTDTAAYNNNETSPYNFKWEIPVTYSHQIGDKTQVWFGLDDDSIDVTVPGSVQYTKFNVDQLGYYRVNYPESDWNNFNILLQLDLNTFSTSDRTSLLNDAFSLAAGSRLSYSTALSLTLYLGDEREVTPWSVAISQIEYMASVFYYTDVFPNLLKYSLQLTNDVYEELGWEDTGDHKTKMLRSYILDMACASGNPDCLKTAGDMFVAWLNGTATIAPNLRSLVYNYGMQQEGNYENWLAMFDRYMNEQNAQEKKKLMKGLTYIQTPWILYKFIQMAKDINIVREQDYFSLLNYIANNRIGEPIVWDFMRDEWDYLIGRFTSNNRDLGKTVSTVTDKFSTTRRLREMQTFFAATNDDAGAGAQYRDIALETVTNNINFVENYSDEINQWLIDNTKANKK